MLIDFLFKLYGDDDGGAGGGGSDDEQGQIKPSDVLQRYGQTTESALRLAEKLADAENKLYRLRERNRTLSQERDALKGTATPEGAVVLTADDAKLWTAYTALGKPDDLGKAVSDRDAAQGELGTLRRDRAILAAAEAHGYKPGTLGKLPSLVGKELVIKDVTEGEATVKRAFVSADGKETALPEYIQQHDPELMPALAVATQTTQQRGTPYPIQSGNGGTRPPENAGKAYLQKAKYAIPGKEN